MKAAQFYGVGDVRVEEIDEPEPGPGEVLVDVAACGICGSDLHFYREGFPYTDERPVTLGHESAGTVIETGEGVDLAAGTDVALGPHTPCLDCPYCESALYNLCRNMNEMSTRPGAFAERAVESAGTVVPLPEGLSAEDAALAQPLSVGLHAVLCAESLGAGTTIAVDLADPQLDAAETYGADVTLNPERDDVLERVSAATDGWGADAAIECSGSSVAMAQAVDAINGANGYESGTVVSVGIQTEDISVGFGDVREGQLRVSGDHRRSELMEVLTLLETGSVDISPTLTHEVTLENLQDGVDLVREGDETVGRVVVDTS